MLTIKKHISECLYNKYAVLCADPELTAEDFAGFLEYPPDEKLGDLAFPCFKLSRALRMAPPAIAAKLADGLADDIIGKAEVVGGYINFYISPEYLAGKLMPDILERGESYGSFDFGKGKTVVLDYSSPNVAKPFHIGHLGTTVIGHSLKKLHQFAGYDCVGVNYLGDWGTQFGKLIVAYRKWGSREQVEKVGIDELVSLYVKFHAEAEKDPSLDDEARAEFTKLEHHDEENTNLWKWFIQLSLDEYSKTYKQLGITFESYNGESFAAQRTDDVIKELNEKDMLRVDDGASLVDLEKYDMPPFLILKKDGSTLYSARDIATAIYRKNTYDFDKSIYVTSAGQSLHFAQLFKVVEMMGYDWAKQMIHVPYGTVSINGAKLATRTGNVILLRDLFAESIEKVSKIIEEKNSALENRDEVAEAVGVGAIIFYYLSNSRIKDINFILEDALNFDGNTGPYAQYTYARTCSIISKAGGVPDVKPSGADVTDPSEAALLKTLSIYPEKVLNAIDELEPSVITRYILDVCAAFNRFYHECQIVTADSPKVRDFRVALTACTRSVIGSAFELICMRKTEKI
ncbi:MAG: arginine--tRNA ligase [Clostridiales bacterium]|nr:arginine--tRNA ligase [Clostridiales bacterium]